MDPELEAILKLSPPKRSWLPWENVSEDRYAAQESVTTLYASLQLPKPRMAWAPSPASMHAASRMLRTIQAGTAHQMVQALVPKDGQGVDREARVALLTMMIDPDVSTQSGGLLIGMIQGVFGKQTVGEYQALDDLRDVMRFEEKDPSGTRAPAMFKEQCLWPCFYPAFTAPRLYALRVQAVIIMPFAKLCWLCRPPLYIKTNYEGRLHCAEGPAAEWPDGFKVWYDRTPQEERNKQLKRSEPLALPETTED